MNTPPARRAEPTQRPGAGGPRGPRAAAQPRALRILLMVIAAAGAVFLGGAMTTYALVVHNLPSPSDLTARLQFSSTKILDRNGVLLYEVFNTNKGKRTDVKLKDIPKPVVNAFLAAEDARFYQNSGIDVPGILRAFVQNVTNRQQLSGGSTITQQLVKNTLLTNERTLNRKIKEAILSLEISRRYSKDQILEMYLNSVYLGNQSYGVEAASETYFGKPVSEVTQAEAAVLAGLPRSPSATNPFADEQAAKNEQKRVLDAMVRHGFLSPADAQAAAAQPLAYNTQQFSEIKAPHFALWVREQLEGNPKYGQQGIYERGLEITTTLDARLQTAAEQIVSDQVAKLGGYNVHDGALVAINPATGEVLAMVGSADYNNKAIHGEVNVALAPRQPGSSIKPITYLAAFLKGWSPGTIIDDVPTTFPGNPPYAPRNYDGQFHGKVTARTALANSYNIPAVKTLQFVGVPAMIDLAKRMGITTFQDPNKYGLALTLGGGEVRLLELTSAYGVLAQGGQRVPPVSILKVTDSSGKVLDQYAGPHPERVVDPAHAYLVTSILADNNARAPGFGANSPLKLSRPAAVKTGTTDDFKDNWTIGFTSQIVVGVWVGNADNQPMRGTTGLTGAAPIWHDFMEEVLKPLPVDPLAPPAGVASAAQVAGQEGCSQPPVQDLVVTGAGAPTPQKCEKPTPPPTATPGADTPTPAATQATVAPTADQQALAATATSQSVLAAQTAQAAQAARQPTSAPPTQPPALQPTQPPATQPTQPPAPTQTPARAAPTATRAPSGGTTVTPAPTPTAQNRAKTG